MKKQLFLLLILVAFAIIIAAPRVTAAADSAAQVTFTASSLDLCMPVQLDSRCNYGEFVPLPNGKGFLKGWVSIVQYTAEDPRWTAECVFTGDAFPPGNIGNFPLMGSFVCTPYDPALASGWWEGTLSQIVLSENFNNTWRAKGYGAFDGLIAISRHSMSNFSEITIIELPEKQK
jgi:hypothetical protein